MEPEGPVGNLCGGANDLGILAGHFDRIRGTASQEVEVNHSADDVILERRSRSAGIRLVDLYVHSVGIEKKHAMRAGGTMLEVDGVVPIQIRTIGDTVGISRPEGAGVIVGRQTEAVGVFAKTVDVWVRGETSLDTDVLWFED